MFKINSTEKNCNAPEKLSFQLNDVNGVCGVPGKLNFEIKEGEESAGGGSVVLERSDDSSLITLTAPQNYNLADLNIEVVDENDNVILSTNQLVYTENEIDLSILAECNNLININNLIVSNTQPIGQPNGHFWFQPL